jgi:hypothetical protein
MIVTCHKKEEEEEEEETKRGDKNMDMTMHCASHTP